MPILYNVVRSQYYYATVDLSKKVQEAQKNFKEAFLELTLWFPFHYPHCPA